MRRLKKLNRLTLGTNDLTKVPRLPKSVERINLRDNQFSGVLPRRSVSGLRNLRELILTGNKLTQIETSALRRTPVEYFDVGDNQLIAIPEGLPRTIRVLKLENNNIKVISSTALGRLKNLAGMIFT